MSEIAVEDMPNYERMKANENVRGLQVLAACASAPGAPSASMLAAAASLSNALGGTGKVVTDVRAAPGPLFVSLTMSESTALVGKLTGASVGGIVGGVTGGLL